MKIAIFAYNFPHKKTQDFIFRILAEGYKISVIYAAEPVKLNIPPSSIKSKITHLGLIHPNKIAQSFGIRYVVAPHNSDDIIKDATNNNIDIAVIAGARILPANVINAFKLGVINFHPGIIPHARGLDALLWSINYDIPLGVTAHLIDKNIDAGQILFIEKLKIREDDTLLDLSEKLYELQLDMLPTALEKTINQDTYLLSEYGNYNRKMERSLEIEVLNKVPRYVKRMVAGEELDEPI